LTSLDRQALPSRMSDIPEQAADLDLSTAVLSGPREKILEHRLVSDLAELMLRRGVELDVMRGEFDAQGHDVVFEAAGIIRHVQLKAMVAGGKRREVNVNVRLRSRPSGCVVWMVYDPLTLRVTEYRWFGAAPGEPMPDLGNRIARHSKGNADGTKLERLGHRLLGSRNFLSLTTVAELADCLFGPKRSHATSLVFAQLRQRFGTEWPSFVRPLMQAPGWDSSAKLAHLIDGYAVLEQLYETDPDKWLATGAAERCPGTDPGELWTTLFLEHRRWRFASPHEPEGEALDHLEQLVAALHSANETEFARQQAS
jgi:hypothetical protein